jgi:hypothetical protein
MKRRSQVQIPLSLPLRGHVKKKKNNLRLETMLQFCAKLYLFFINFKNILEKINTKSN